MKKQDLRSGMTVEYRDGDRRLVLLNSKNGDVLVEIINGRCITVNNLKYYNEKLESLDGDGKYLDIVKVFDINNKLIWERKEIPQQINITINATLDQGNIDNIEQQIKELLRSSLNRSKIKNEFNLA